MLKNKFLKISEDEEFYENEFLDYYDGDEEKAEAFFNQSLELFLERLNRIQASSQGILVWRAINAKSIDKLDLINVGGSWSYNKKSAHTWYGGDGIKFIIQGVIPYESIDFETTLRQNLVNPDEEEFRLNSNAFILIEQIQDEEYNILKEFNPELESSAGKVGTVGDWTGN